MRRDALPEYSHYSDDGCAVHPACLSCPLERCIHDNPDPVRVSALATHNLILHYHNAGVPVSDIAKHVGRSRRAVFRHLATAKKGV